MKTPKKNLKQNANDNGLPVSLSVVMPAYNAAAWLHQSIPKVETAIKNAGIKNAEIIVVNDGSSDNTAEAAKELKTTFPLRVISQKNGGRFLARDTGVKEAVFDYILFIDTRIFIGENALLHIMQNINQQKLVWTSHVVIDKKSNIYARFWEAITFISWRKYFAHPRDCSYGIEEFDYYPKGTTCFFVPKKIIQEANDWFKTQTKNAKASNDDTLLIRRIAEKDRINLSPKFFCTYHARTSLKQYSKHVYHRGKVFVDGFLRRDGNRFFWPLVAFLVLSVLVPAALLFFPGYIVLCFVIALAAWILEVLAALALKVPPKDAFSLWFLSPLFVIFFGAGIWKAMLDIYVLSKPNRQSS